MAEVMRYKAFISYNHEDAAVARRLHRRLERFRPPRGVLRADGSPPERLYPIYRDRDEMAASPSLPDAVEAALAASDHLIVLCSPTAAASAWVNMEIRLFTRLKSADRILPVIVKGDPPRCLPPALLDALSDPMAPDLQDGRDGFSDGALKIIAGLWGVPFDALKNREAARQRRRARLNLALAAAFSGLVVFAGLSEIRAREEAERAQAQADAAEARSLASIARFTFERNPGESSVAAMAAAQSLSLSPTPEAQALIRDALRLAPLRATETPFPWPSPLAATSADGRVAAFMDYYAAEGEPARSSIVRLGPDLVERERVAFDGFAEAVPSANGAWLAAAGRLRKLSVLDAATGETALDVPVASGFSATFDPGGSTLYVATQLGEILRWSAETGQVRRLAETPASGVRRNLPRLAATADGRWLLRSERGRPTLVISTESGATRAIPFKATFATTGFEAQEPAGAVLHPDGTHAIAYGTYNTGTLWTLDTLEARWSFDDDSRRWSPGDANKISDDGALFARGYSDGAVVLREMSGGAVLRRLDHGGEVRSVSFIDGSRAMAVGGEGGVSIWSTENGEIRARCASDAYIWSIAVEAGGDGLLAGAEDGRLIRCDPATGAILAEKRFAAPVRSVVAAPGEIAIALKQSESLETWTEIAFFERDARTTTRLSLNEPFDQLKLSANGAFAATRSFPRGVVAIWRTSTGELVRRISARGQLVGLTPEGDRLLMNDRSLEAFDVSTGRRVAEMGEAAGVSNLHAERYRDLLITEGKVDGERERWAWSAASGERLWRVAGAAAMTPGGGAFARYDDEAGRWRVVDRISGEEIGSIPFASGGARPATSPDGASLLVTRRAPSDGRGHHDEIELWNVRDGARLWSKSSAGRAPRLVSLSPDRGALVFGALDDDGGFVRSAEIFDWVTGASVFSIASGAFFEAEFAVDPSLTAVAITTEAGVEFRSLGDGALLWASPRRYESGMAFAPDGTFIAAGRPGPDGEHEITVLDRATGAVIREWVVDISVKDIAVTSDGSLILAALNSDEWSGVRAWRVEDGRIAFEVGTEGAPLKLHPLADPDRLVIIDARGVVRLYSLAQGRALRGFSMATRADGGAFSANGARAITRSGARLRYWDAGNGEEIATLATSGQAAALAISPDGAEIAYVTQRERASGDGATTSILEIWRPETGDDPLKLATARADRIAYDPTGAALMLRLGDDAVRIYDARTLAPRFEVTPLPNGAFDAIRADTPAFTRDGKILALLEKGDYGQGNTNARRAAMRMFDVATGEEVARFDVDQFGRGRAATTDGFFYADVTGRSHHFRVSDGGLDDVLAERFFEKILAIPGSNMILASNYHRRDALLDLETGDRIDLAADEREDFTLSTAADPSGRYIAISRLIKAEGQPLRSDVRVLDAKTGEILAKTPEIETQLGHVAFAEGGEAVIVGQYGRGAIITHDRLDGVLFKWRWRDGELTPLIEDNPVAGFRVSADGRWLITSEGGKNSDSGETFGRIQSRLVRLSDGAAHVTPTDEIFAPRLVLSDDGARFGVFSAASPTEGEIREASAGGGFKTLLKIVNRDAAFFGRPLGFTEDDRLFILAERSGARVFDLETGAARRLRVPGRAKLHALSGDRAFLAIGGDDFASVWDLGSFERVAELKLAGLRALTFAGADARSLLGVTEDGVMRLAWDAGELIETACRVYRRDAWEAGLSRVTGVDAPSPCGVE